MGFDFNYNYENANLWYKNLEKLMHYFSLVSITVCTEVKLKYSNIAVTINTALKPIIQVNLLF